MPMPWQHVTVYSHLIPTKLLIRHELRYIQGVSNVYLLQVVAKTPQNSDLRDPMEIGQLFLVVIQKRAHQPRISTPWR